MSHYYYYYYYRVCLFFTVFLILLTDSVEQGQSDAKELDTQIKEISEIQPLNHVKRAISIKKSKNKKLKEQNVPKKGKKKSSRMEKKGGKFKKVQKKRKRKGGKHGKKASKKKKKKKGTKKKANKVGKNPQKEETGKGPTGRAKADNEIFEGPYGFEHPEAIDWTLPQYRCPDCEDTLIIYDPWYAPPPTLHIPVFCSSNLSEFSNSNSFSNFGPNITFIFIPGTLNCTDPAKARLVNSKQFSIEITQRDEEEEEETAVDTLPADNGYFDCGKSVTQDMKYMSCGEEEPVYRTDQTSKKCFWHFHAYDHWRRQLKFTSWSLPSCVDNSTKGDCCKAGPHLLISKTGYAKKFEAYCGPQAPKFSKSDFEKGKARWLVVFNNTGNTDNFSPQMAVESPTIGYRKSAAFDQLYYGERCVCGLRKGNKHPAIDPENGQERGRRKGGRKMKARKKKTKKNPKGKLKTKKYKKKRNHSNKKKKTGKKADLRKNNGGESVVKREIKRGFKRHQKKDRRKNHKKSLQKKKKNRKQGKQAVAAAEVGPQDRIKQLWPWMASITYSTLYTCTGYTISPLIVITTTKCFPDLETVSGNDTEALTALNSKKDLIVVIGQDEQEIGQANPLHYWEEERGVAEIVIHPNCHPVSSPQFCVLALVLSQNFSMEKQQRPRPACLNCQVDSYQSKLLKGFPFLTSYGLQPPQQNAKAGTYKAPTFIKSYLSSPSDCITRNSTTSETYCLQVLGDRYMCDVDRVNVGGNTQLGKRDYGGLLINRVGRNGYKINFQVVGLLWNFNCGSSGPAEYIPTWPSLAWMMNLMMTRDRPCTKLIRKSDWTRTVKTNGYYDNGNII